MKIVMPRDDLLARLEYLEEINRFTIDALEVAASLGDFQRNINRMDGPRSILREMASRIKRLIPFEAVGFYLVDESTSDFYPAYTQPAGRKREIVEEVDFLIDNGTFAWALRENRAVFVSSKDFAKRIVLHSMSTRARIRGMFIGILSEQDVNIPGVSIALLSIILLHSANSLESFELYRMIKKARDELEMRVEERTRELARANEKMQREMIERKQTEEMMHSLQEQLRHSQKMEAIGRLAGGIAHDFNNLLMVIRGHCEMSLLRTPEDHPIREDLLQIKKATDRAASLTRQLLAFGRRQVMEMKIVDLNSLLQDLEPMLRRVMGEGIELVMALSKDLGRVKVDPGQMEQVMLNLAINAKDAMPRGGKFIVETANVLIDEHYARSHFQTAAGPYALLAVTDTGCGMSAEVKERIFEPFFTTKEKGKGTGLGLASVYGILKQSGASIWVYSEPGQGTTFKIYFPLVDGDVSCRSIICESIPSVAANETILLVENDPCIRKLAIRALRDYGYRVLEAGNGEEAIHVAEEHSSEIALLLTDITIPEMGGRELYERLKSVHPGLRVLFTSGYPENAAIVQNCLQPGFPYLPKPYSPISLVHKVRKVLDDPFM